MTAAAVVRDRAALAAEFVEVLHAEMGKRARRDGWVDVLGECRRELAWVLAERAALVVAVNDARRARGKRVVASCAIAGAEAEAFGHTDYAQQLARSCARIVVDHP